MAEQNVLTFPEVPTAPQCCAAQKKTSGNPARATGSRKYFIIFHCPLDGEQFSSTACAFFQVVIYHSFCAFETEFSRGNVTQISYVSSPKQESLTFIAPSAIKVPPYISITECRGASVSFTDIEQTLPSPKEWFLCCTVGKCSIK